MIVSLIAPNLLPGGMVEHFVAQARIFQDRGDQVALFVVQGQQNLAEDLEDLLDKADLPRSDLYIYHLAEEAIPPSLRQRTRGIVFVHDHGRDPEAAYSLAAHYADLCLVADGTRRQELLAESGLAPERVCLLPELDQEAAYRSVLLEIVGRALADDWPPAPKLPTEGAMKQNTSKTPAAVASPEARRALAHSQADVMQRDYQVRSRIPLLGGLVAWLRRNLTSHLWEPYLDPTLERQVAFNQSLVDWMGQIEARLATLETRLEEVQALDEKETDAQ
jgi:hypothetical protein